MALPAQTSLVRRLIVGVALLGVVVVTHLALQKANGFANGCTGLGAVDYTTATTGTAAGCAAVTEGEYADFLGIPNIALGLIFYVLVAGLRLAYVARGDDRLRLASAGVVGVGMVYTAYLVYLQAAVIGSFCALCMTSAAVVTALFVLHLVEHLRLRSAGPVPTPRRAGPEARGLGALRPYTTILGGFAVLFLGTFALAARTAPDAQASGLAATPVSGPTPSIQDVTGACEYDPSFSPIADLGPFTTGPSMGNPDAEVTVVKVFDPNCPHCRDLAETLDPYIAENPETARYFFVPFALRQESVGQVVALKLAQREGKFFELMHAMFERQDATWGMTQDELVEAVGSVGMDGAAFQRALENPDTIRPLLEETQRQSEAVTAAFTNNEGGLSVPKLAFNGRVVAPTFASYSPRCFSEFIAGAQPVGAAVPDPAP